jgi:hypothetical protein
MERIHQVNDSGNLLTLITLMNCGRLMEGRFHLIHPRAGADDLQPTAGRHRDGIARSHMAEARKNPAQANLAGFLIWLRE